MVVAVVPTSRSDEHVGLDPVGTVLSALGIGAIVLGIIEGPIRGWTEPLTVGALVVGRRAGRRVRALGAAGRSTRCSTHGCSATAASPSDSASLLVLFIALFGLFLVILQYLQLMLGYSALKAAVALLPLTFLMIPISACGRAPLGALRHEARQRDRPRGHRRRAWSRSPASTPGSGYLGVLVAQLLLGAGIGLAMTPATNAIVSSLPTAKQGVASAVNDTTREIGTALGIALMGSMFNTGYRNAIDGELGGLPAGVADQARESPGLALGHRPPRRPAPPAPPSTDAARAAFTSGMRLSMLVGAALLLGAAAYVWFRGPDRQQEAFEEVIDDEADLEPALA